MQARDTCVICQPTPHHKNYMCPSCERAMERIEKQMATPNWEIERQAVKSTRLDLVLSALALIVVVLLLALAPPDHSPSPEVPISHTANF